MEAFLPSRPWSRPGGFAGENFFGPSFVPDDVAAPLGCAAPCGGGAAGGGLPLISVGATPGQPANFCKC